MPNPHFVPSKTAKQVVSTLEEANVELVTVPSGGVKHVCKFEKPGWCKKKEAPC